VARILGGLHTAQYQYIPAIAFPQGESLNLRLNTPPSFHNPKSVIVIGLPSIQKSVAPPLRASDGKRVTCLLQPDVAVPVEGAPLVFSTAFAHDLVLHMSDGKDLPVEADAFQGGLVLAKAPERKVLPEPTAPKPAPPVAAEPKKAGVAVDAPLTGTIRGFWGFDPFEGPTLPLQDRPGTGWKVLSGEPLIAGREDHLVLSSNGSACLRSVAFDGPDGRMVTAGWKPMDPEGATAGEAIDVTLPLGRVQPGSVELAIEQYGAPKEVALGLRTYSEPAELSALTLHAGDRMATLTGKHLEQVRQLKINDLEFMPAAGAGGSSVPLTLPEAAASPGFKAGERVTGRVTLSDGRVLDVPVTVAPPRPQLTLKSRSVPKDKDAPITLLGKDDLRADLPVTLVLKSSRNIPRTEEIEVATVDGSLSTRLNFASGALVLQDAHTLRVTVDAVKALGGSVFGPVRLRAIETGMDPGDWIALGTLVRVPAVTSLACPSDAAKPCELAGASLYLIDAVASSVSLDEALVSPVAVPEDFSDTTLQVPRPGAGPLYLRLRDDPDTLATLNLPVAMEQRPMRPAAKAPVAKLGGGSVE
jgi:hypothetical protein